MDKTNETDQPVAYPPVQEKLLVWKLWTVIAAVSLGSAITILMRLFQYGRPDADQTLNSLIVLLTATLSGWLSWWLLITRRRMLTKLRGALAGAFTGLCSYFLIFQVTNLVYGAALPEFFGASLGTRIASGFILSIITLIFSGWFSLPLLAGVGMVLARVQMATFPNLEHRLALPMRGIGTRWRSFSRDHPMLQMFFAVLFSGGVILILLGGWIWTRPLRVDDLRTEGKALNDYAESIGALRAMLEAEAADPNLNPECASQLIEQGRRTTKVIVFYHGFTNCPAQFIPLAEQFALRGYNVYIPRIPYHGYANRMTPALAQLSAEELVRFADESIDLAHGLGDSITVVGLSAGGNIAGWIAQERTDVAQVTLIAPMFHVHGLPPFSIRPVASTILA
ncbi:MAG: alpha/beta fold hydrolase, partial [Chloroflexia bacterium]|nr:alpha/beta fold hydrolase [Chloroflexia bacterium]